MMKRRVVPVLNWLLLLSLILTSCSGLPTLSTPTPAIPTPTEFLQAVPPALIETDPPAGSVIGHLSPITFYFNQVMNKQSVEISISGFPAGAFTWTDEATVIFTPSEQYPPNSKLKLSIANSIQSVTGFGLAEPIDLTYSVSDYLRATNLLPKVDAKDVNVDAAIVTSFNQPVVPLGADQSSLPAAFSIQPSVQGSGEWINTSTYIFYPKTSMAGGTDYTVSLNPALKTVTGVGLDGGVQNSWNFTTSRPRVVTVEPSTETPIPLDPEIKLTFNQPMDEESVRANFQFSGTAGKLGGKISWDEDATVLTFVPEKMLDRNVGYILNVGKDAKSQGGMTLGEDYGAVLRTYDNFAVTSTNSNFSTTTISFNAPLPEGDYTNFVTGTPELDNFAVELSEDGFHLIVRGDFTPDTNYIIQVSGLLKDKWGQSLGDPFILDFRTAPLNPSVSLQRFGPSTVFVRPDDPVLDVSISNLIKANVIVAPVTPLEFLPMYDSFDNQQSFIPSKSSTYEQMVNVPSSETRAVQLKLAQSGTQLVPELYYVNVASSQFKDDSKKIFLTVSSHVNLTFKLGATEALLWAVDLPTQTPIAGAPVSIYDGAGNPLVSGTTDSDGLWKTEVPATDRPLFAMLGQPGDDNFGLAVSNWADGLRPWDFGYESDVRVPHTEVYMYTDRPIYRPGQTVYFRGVARQAFNGRYELPTVGTITLNLSDANGTNLATFDAQLTPYGTFNGQFKLSNDAVPGYYTFQNQALQLYFSFQVAEYRKPEVDLGIALSADKIKLGTPAQATVNARYFFDAPAGNLDVHWALYTRPDTFYLPNYNTGVIDTSWLDVFHMPTDFGSVYLGKSIADGTGQTTPDGTLSIELPAIPESEVGQIVTLEVTATDESGLPVSASAEMHVHPADFYIGVHPDQWTGTVNAPIGFEVYTVDWSQNPSGDKALVAEFKQVRWEKTVDKDGYPHYKPVYTSVSSSNLATAPDGKARLSFVPPNSGTYMLDVSGEGAHTQTLIWVGGAGSASWPDLPNQRFEITADKDSYVAGDTAKIFIPNPFVTNSLALVTVERGIVSKAEVIRLSGSGKEYSLPLTADDAPNVYVSVTVMGQGNDFRAGLVNIPVAPDAQKLNVQVLANPTEAGPRDDVTFDVQVTDNAGQPVEGEFSFSVVDKAVLALADPNAPDILPAFYSNQPLGIDTGISLAAYSGRQVTVPGGLGGGGGEPTTVTRENFPDTAYWNPSLVTNSEGRGQVTMTLPNSLTTWKVDMRGLTADTKVGQAETEIVATKSLLIRPVTPRFLVNGDHALMAAIINNNTANKLSASVNLQTDDGFVLDEPDKATQQVDIPAHGRTRVEWWGKAGLVESADLVFSVTTTDTPALQDSARPSWGKLPILQYTAPQAFVSGGALRGATSQQEVISLPRTFTPSAGGGLELELSPSLAGSLLSGLEAMEVPDSSLSAEANLSYLLPNVEVYRSLNNAGLNDPKLTDRVTQNIATSVSRLATLQNADGGWSWWGKPIPETEIKSDPYITAYVFFGLLRARAIGISVNDDVLQRAGVFLQKQDFTVNNDTRGWQLDDLTFIQFVLAQVNSSREATINALYDARDRLSPSSIALLASILNTINPADQRVRDLLSNLESSAIQTATSAHWETSETNIFMRGSPVYTTSVVVYVLAQLELGKSTGLQRCALSRRPPQRARIMEHRS
ncbi:MAG: Ig-like domain-containing protein [Anaerolineales bacterium]